MIHLASPSFWKCYDQLPPPIRTLADKNFDLMKDDSTHPSLHLKQVGRYWSVRVGLRHRALGVEIENGILWFWIGSHAEYDGLIR